MTFLVVVFIGLLIWAPQVPAGWPRFVYILGLFGLAACIVVWQGRQDDRDVKTTAEWNAEKQARLDAEIAEIKSRGYPWTV